MPSRWRSMLRPVGSVSPVRRSKRQAPHDQSDDRRRPDRRRCGAWHRQRALRMDGYDEQADRLRATFAPTICSRVRTKNSLSNQAARFPSPLNPSGVKGVGEDGVVAAGAAVVSAVENALESFGDPIEEIPLRPTRLSLYDSGDDARATKASVTVPA